MSVFFTQQRRKLAEATARDWPTLRAAILAARGARESADVGDEEAERAYQAKRAAEEAAMWAGARNMTPEEYAEYAAGLWAASSFVPFAGIEPRFALLLAMYAEPAEGGR